MLLCVELADFQTRHQAAHVGFSLSFTPLPGLSTCAANRDSEAQWNAMSQVYVATSPGPAIYIHIYIYIYIYIYAISNDMPRNLQDTV